MTFVHKLQLKIRDGSFAQILRELGWIVRWGGRFRWAVVFYTALGLFGVAMSLGAGVLSKRIIDAVTGFDSSAFVPAAVSFTVMQLLRIVANIFTGRLSASVRIRSEQHIRGQVYDAVMNSDWEQITRFHTGDILNRVESDVSAVSASVLGWLPDFITRLAQFVGTLAVILYYDATLALLALLSAPVTLVLSGFMARALRRHNQRMRQVSSQLTAFNEESFQNVQSIKSFGLGQVYSRRLRRVQEEQYRAVMDYTRFHVGTTAVMNLVGAVVTVLCFGWGVYRLWSGHITYGTMTLFLQMASSLSGAFSALVAMVPSAISAATAAGRIMAIVELPQEDHALDAQAEAFRRGCTDGVTVMAENMSCAYAGDDAVLEDVAFSAAPGQVVALIGPSGEGKTTMLRLLLGILHPTAGRLTVSGREGAMDISPSTRSLFAYVPQTSILFSGTVAENLRLMNPEATDAQLYEALRMACADGFISRHPMGLEAAVQERGGGFSQGQIQRLMLARALLSPAPVLLLDEATSALDPDTERRVLENIMGDRGKRTCILTTHRMGVLAQCDRVYRIRGKNVEEITGERYG